MTVGETWYMALILGAFAVFAAVLAWQTHQFARAHRLAPATPAPAVPHGAAHAD